MYMYISRFLRELKDATAARFNQLTYSSFALAFALNAVFMVTVRHKRPL
jgi:hypothetical protein